MSHAYLFPVARQAIEQGADFDERRSTSSPADADGVLHATDNLERLARDLTTDCACGTFGPCIYSDNLIADLRLQWLGITALRQASGDDIDQLHPDFEGVAYDVFTLVLEDVAQPDHGARLDDEADE